MCKPLLFATRSGFLRADREHPVEHGSFASRLAFASRPSQRNFKCLGLRSLASVLGSPPTACAR